MKIRLLIVVSGGFFLLIDQFFKWQAFYNWTMPNLLSPYFGWQLFLNRGVAFNLPLPNWLIILLTLPMIGLVSYLLIREWQKKETGSPRVLLAWSLILAGAVSNLLDRIIYRQVIDYVLIGTAIINLGDILIIGGLVLYLAHTKIYVSKT